MSPLSRPSFIIWRALRIAKQLSGSDQTEKKQMFSFQKWVMISSLIHLPTADEGEREQYNIIHV